MKIGVDCGHTLSGADYGAVGVKAESNLTREVGNKVISKLKSLGHTVINCTCDNNGSLGGSLSHRYNTANNNNVDLFVSIHFNCFNGNAYGTEVFTYGAKQFTEANSVLKNISSLGFYNRGIKDGSKLSVLRNTKMKSMLVECCFCDNANDMSRYNAENMADAIVKGLVGETITNNNSNSSKCEVTSSPSTKASQSNCVNLDGKFGICIGNDVRVRSSKDTTNDSNILGHFNKGDKIKLFRKEGDWMHIYYPPHGGYIYSSYIEAGSNHTSSGNSYVKTLQQELNNQFNKGLSIDGIMGQNTINALITVRQGARGNLSKIIQELLISEGYSVGNYGADGVFGQGTHDAVVRFQKTKGLGADGIVGRNTWMSLLK